MSRRSSPSASALAHEPAAGRGGAAPQLEPNLAGVLADARAGGPGARWFVRCADRQRAAVAIGAGLREQPRRGGEHFGVEMAAQRACAELGREPAFGKARGRGLADLELHAALGQTAALGEPADRDLGDPRDLGGGQRVEHDDLIEPIDQLGAERGEHGIAIAALFALVLALARRDPERALRAPGAEVRGQHDDRVVEVRRAAAAVGQTCLAEHLEQEVEHRRVSLLDLVEQHHAERLAADRGGEPALSVALAGAAEQPLGGPRIGVLAHVEPDHLVGRAEQVRGDRARELGLAGAGRADEQQAGERLVGGLEPGLGDADRLGDAAHGRILADHPAAQLVDHHVARTAAGCRRRSASGIPVAHENEA